MMDGMDDLVQFLSDRLNDDEQTARAAGDGWYGYEPEQQIAFVPPEDSRHIARHDPARVLRDIEAKRQLLDRYAEVASNDIDEPYEYAYGWANGLGAAVRLLALPYADHPDYRDDWRP